MADESTFETRAFATPADFDAWLASEHDRAPGLFLKIAKKSAGIPSLTAAEAVEVALCHGWIDGRGNRVDDDWFTVRYTPRRPKSVWSQKNVETVARLIADGRMRPAGLAAVEAAQADGRWDRAYAGPATITVPDDLAAALAASPAAQEAFAGLDGANRYAVLWRVHTAATPQTGPSGSRPACNCSRRAAASTTEPRPRCLGPPRARERWGAAGSFLSR